MVCICPLWVVYAALFVGCCLLVFLDTKTPILEAGCAFAVKQ